MFGSADPSQYPQSHPTPLPGGAVLPLALDPFVGASLTNGVAGILTKFDVTIPFAGDQGYWLLLAANILFILGCITRGF